MARPGIEPRTLDLRVRCPTDCATRPGWVNIFSNGRLSENVKVFCTTTPTQTTTAGLWLYIDIVFENSRAKKGINVIIKTYISKCNSLNPLIFYINECTVKPVYYNGSRAKFIFRKNVPSLYVLCVGGILNPSSIIHQKTRSL